MSKTALRPEEVESERKIFRDYHNSFIDELTTLPKISEDLPEVSDWWRKLLSYNVCGGKMNRGFMAYLTAVVLSEEQFFFVRCPNQYLKAAESIVPFVKIPGYPCNTLWSSLKISLLLGFAAKHMLPVPIELISYKRRFPDRKADGGISTFMGFGLEMMQASFLIDDDVMDRSETRRGNPCWYLVEGAEKTMLADSSVVDLLALTLYRKHPNYRKICDLYRVSGSFFLENYFSTLLFEYCNLYVHPFHSFVHLVLKRSIDLLTRLRTQGGQSLDVLSEPGRCENMLDRFDMPRYQAIIKYKASFYTTHCPVITGMLLAGEDDQGVLDEVAKILFAVGSFYQVQDDYLDCYGDVSVTGKIGTDIQDGKCTWFIVKALEKADQRQRRILAENYGKNLLGSVKKVKEVYDELNLLSVYKSFEENSMSEFKQMIASSPLEDRVKMLLQTLLNILCGREKSIKKMSKTAITRDEVESQRKQFNSYLSGFIEELAAVPEICADFPEVSVWWEQMLSYNVKGGKMNRGFMAYLSAVTLAEEKGKLTEDFRRSAAAVGFGLEMMQASLLVDDDIIDKAETRRGKPCWYRVKGAEKTALIDAAAIDRLSLKLYKKHCWANPNYRKVCDLYRLTRLKTMSGQTLDGLSEPERCADMFNRFDMRLYQAIILNKTAFYSVQCPVIIGMLLAGENDQGVLDEASKILCLIGSYFQTQDDYLDCYGDVSVTGKIGTDIQDGKCTWFIVKALEKADERQRGILAENYGKNSPENVKKVREVFDELNLFHVYKSWEENEMNVLNQMIGSASLENTIQIVLRAFLNILSGREK
ncbi:unnamed protein product [Notodromas monacha]|uniref:Farnesyl pyrophosphate synthase n=2 Tax=Notodromas monacha TaxID=399045 RepID=A0A7R9BUY5_9CRUS|nr:unnamed protein product [Notodromas monacha]CAG0921852.1 unnamed protein product [Notodromas monacha]